LNEAGCDHIFRDRVSGATTDRPGLTEALNQLREGDTLVVWRLELLDRSAAAAS
jgi:DNA invertase Pin-like site-specific DNA recombinase